MQYQVPQFIEVEDKIVGPFTLRQFVYLAGGAGLSFLIWKFFPVFIAVLLIIPVALLSIALTFYQINKKPFIYIVEAAFKYILRGRLYLWSSERSEKKKSDPVALDEAHPVQVPNLSDNRIKDLAWNLDIQEHIVEAELQKKNAAKAESVTIQK